MIDKVYPERFTFLLGKVDRYKNICFALSVL